MKGHCTAGTPLPSQKLTEPPASWRSYSLYGILPKSFVSIGVGLGRTWRTRFFACLARLNRSENWKYLLAL